MMEPSPKTHITAIVLPASGSARQRAGRTLRSAKMAGCCIVDLAAAMPRDLAEFLAKAETAVWALRAGTWVVSLQPASAPPESATGKPICAIGWPIGSIAGDGDATKKGPRETFAGIEQDDQMQLDAWRQLYHDFGGDLCRAIEARVALPPMLSVWLDPYCCRETAAEMQTGKSFDEALSAELSTGQYRIVRYAPLDVHFDKRLRVLQVITSLQRGGAERLTIELATGLNAAGVHCRVATIGSPSRTPFTHPAGTCDLAQLPAERNERVAAAVRVAVRDGSDVVHAHLLDRDDLAQIAAAGLPLLSTVHNSRRGWQAGQAEMLPSECDLLIGCAQAVERELHEEPLTLPMRTVWNGIDPQRVANAAGDWPLRQKIRDEWQIGANDFVLLTLANPRPQKRFPLLPEIVAAVQRRFEREGIKRTVKLLLAGEGAQSHPAAREEIEATNRAIDKYQLADAVRWVGAMDDVSRVLAAADILLSASGHEGLSLAYLEALAAGVPVVATDVGGTRELVGEEVPLRLLPVDGSPNDYAEAVYEIAVGRTVRASVRLPDFTIDAMQERYRWLYPRVISARGKRQKKAKPGRGIWLITNNFSTGGAQSSARRLLTALARDGIPVRAAVLQEDEANPTPGLCALRDSGVPVEILPAAGTVDTAFAVARLLERIDTDPPQSVLFWNAIPEYKLLLADALLDTPVFDVSPGEMFFASLERYFRRPRAGLPYRSAADYGRLLRGVIVKYQAEGEQAARLLQAPVHVVPNGVLMPDTRAQKPTNGHLVIGTAARINPQKRLEDLLAAIRLAQHRLPSFTLKIAGGVETGAEEYAEELRQLANGLPVEWLGDVRDVSSFLNGVVLFAQISEPAGCPNASLEALAAGVPIVATNVGGAAEQIVDGVTGRLTPRRDTPALAEALVAMSNDAALRERLAQGGYTHAQRAFSLERMAADYRRICLPNE